MSLLNKMTNKEKLETKKNKERKGKEIVNMKNVTKKLLTVGVALATTYTASATGVIAGTTVSNQATAGFSVGGVSQTSVNSNTTSFVVDQKVIFTVSEVGGSSTVVVPNATGQVLTYLVTHNGNYVGDFGLSAINATSGDNFDTSSSAVFVESGTTVGYQAVEDTGTYVDELAADGTKTVYIVSTIPSTPTNAQTSIVHLEATAKAGGVASTQGATLTQTAGADTAGSIDIVFADAAGSATGDAARDGKHSASDTYLVTTATISVVKSSVVVSDPINNTTNPKRIPGAVIRYTIAVSNSGGATADNISLSDTLSASTTFVATSLTVDGNAEDDNATGTDDTPLNGGNPTGGSHTSGVVSAQIFALPAAGTKNVVFDVTVN